MSFAGGYADDPTFYGMVVDPPCATRAGMSAFQRFIYAVALAVFKAWWDIRDAREMALKEVITDGDSERAARFSAAVDRLHRENPGHP